MVFRHLFQVSAPLTTVVDFHARSESLALITPPPFQVRIHTAPPRLGEGDEMAFSLGIGIFQIEWRARIEQVSQHGFLDRQIRGPFREWEHHHTFLPLSNGNTIILDEVHARLKSQPNEWLVGLSMWLGMPVLFGFRAWKTRQSLAQAIW